MKEQKGGAGRAGEAHQWTGVLFRSRADRYRASRNNWGGETLQHLGEDATNWPPWWTLQQNGGRVSTRGLVVQPRRGHKVWPAEETVPEG